MHALSKKKKIQEQDTPPGAWCLVVRGAPSLPLAARARPAARRRSLVLRSAAPPPGGRSGGVPRRRLSNRQRTGPRADHKCAGVTPSCWACCHHDSVRFLSELWPKVCTAGARRSDKIEQQALGYPHGQLRVAPCLCAGPAAHHHWSVAHGELEGNRRRARARWGLGSGGSSGSGSGSGSGACSGRGRGRCRGCSAEPRHAEGPAAGALHGNIPRALVQTNTNAASSAFTSTTTTTAATSCPRRPCGTDAQLQVEMTESARLGSAYDQ